MSTVVTRTPVCCRAGAAETNLVTLAWDQLQAGLQCCGAASHADFARSNQWLATKSGMQVGCSDQVLQWPGAAVTRCCSDQVL